MRSSIILRFVLAIFLAAPALSHGPSPRNNPSGNNAILLSQVQTLTLRANRLTSSRRVSPIPQLQCTGPSKRLCDMYPIDVMRCSNAGYDYDEEDVQWTCTASLPPELKLGATDVVCEGYRNADDRWVLKGSCGVEYRLLLTDLGERKFGRELEDNWSETTARHKWQNVVGSLIFFGFMVAVFVFILWSQCFGRPVGYEFGRRRNGYRGTSSFNRNDPGEGSSRSSRFSAPTSTSTGFGSTRRSRQVLMSYGFQRAGNAKIKAIVEILLRI
ncbi:DUF1183 domain protein [Aspergillus tanneri]|uniref:Store-operated calcium entry-associated regulatory factor n=1 Tax=Aspergillus tanneri TaxID=1220188 RepID=A0A5M9MCS6_9EURO|nr:uncharacterized protein ATNIH1004_010027 [Aspergillus tanneri]KAA8643260.1 hypothetical protein ATNIH1004_010027 [Aspergillus tanneri]